MNLPNKLTILRMLMIPLFVVLLAIPHPAGRYLAACVFIAASLTDTADGYLARKHNLITDFGKFMDPLADKLLVCTALICLVHMDEIPYWIVIIIIAREFVISGFRLVAADNGLVIAASMWGKVKTVFQMVMVIVVLFGFPGAFWHALAQFLIYASLILTVVSLIDYLIKNRGVLGTER